ncbi:TIGR01777 family oxidoreductase [Sessilibacter corallicola]|uniref:TIGR01777 family oxidoreductase n=1 Tax=Sessilibacter corallicola TaxID=2904075 RepID=A0ABQ0AA97_9GAMM
MNILMTGGTGFIGRQLIASGQQHAFTVLTRQSSPVFASANVKVINTLQDLSDLNEFDAVINLAGEPIVGRRWSDAQKQKIRASRIQTTQQLVELFERSSSAPDVFLSGSAIGIYGDTGEQKVDEFSDIAHNQNDFAQTLCRDWEAEACNVKNSRLVLLRTGIVLGDGGALAQMLPAFKFGFGGPLATGNQYMSWIHLQDIVTAIYYVLDAADVSGSVNLVAPNPVTNAQFTKSLAKACGRWAPFRVPKCALKLLLGESSQLLTDSQRIIPSQLLNNKFEFAYPNIDEAFSDLRSL